MSNRNYTVLILSPASNIHTVRWVNALVERGQDTATWWKILKQINQAHGMNEVLSYYRRTDESLSANKLTALKRTWNLYRNVEGLGLIVSAYNFCWYVLNAVRRRV